MNRLSFGLLCLVATESLSGYDLNLRLNKFWHTNHSAIYPLLLELEEKQYVKHTLIKQNDKPDKKMYNITDKGYDTLIEWIKSPTNPAVVKSEMMFKVYCLQAFDIELVEKLLTEMEEECKKRLKEQTESLQKLRKLIKDEFEITRLAHFGKYILLQRLISESKIGIKWCNWIRNLYKNKDNINFYDIDFIDI